jgi:hypothetical protein
MSGSYDANYVYFEGTFQPGTIDSSNVGLLIGLDADRNLSTGADASSGSFFPIGAEFSFNFSSSAPNNPGRFTIRQWISPSSTTLVGSILPVFSANGFYLAIPWEALGSAAAYDFGMAAGTPISNRTFSPSDFVTGPNYALQGPASVETPSWSYDPQFIAAVPEPSSIALLLAGMGIIGAAVKRRRAERPSETFGAKGPMTEIAAVLTAASESDHPPFGQFHLLSFS